MSSSGDDAASAFTDLVAATTGRLLRTAYLLCYDHAEAEDLVQETWARMARRWHKLHRRDNPLAYARRVLVNVAIGASVCARLGRRHRRERRGKRAVRSVSKALGIAS